MADAAVGRCSDAERLVLWPHEQDGAGSNADQRIGDASQPGAADAAVRLSVAARYGLELAAPAEVVLGEAAFVVEVRNTGNVAIESEVVVRLTGRSVASRILPVAPGATAVAEFALETVGSYVVTAAGADGSLERRNVEVVRFGGPTPAPFELTGVIEFRATSRPRADAIVTLSGPVSDVLRIDAKVDAGSLARSHLEVGGSAFEVRLGPGWRDPHQLGVAAESVFAATLRLPGWTAGFVAAGAEGDPAIFALSAGFDEADRGFAAMAGVRDGGPLLALRGRLEHDEGTVNGLWRLEDGSHDASLGGTIDGPAGTTSLAVAGADLGGDRPTISLDLQHVHDATRTFAQARWPLDGDQPWDGRVGLATTVALQDAGDVRVSAQVGTRERQFGVEYRADLPDDWRILVGVGGRDGASGLVVSGEARLTRVPRDRYVSYEGRVTLAPDTLAWTVRLATQHQRQTGPWKWSAGGTWLVPEPRLTATAAVEHASGPWTIAITSSVAYDARASVNPWSVALSVRARHVWSWPVPEAVTARTGGRGVAIVDAVVQSSGVPMAGVRVDVGPYRFVTGGDGRFQAELPPGNYAFRLDTGSVPIVARLLDPATKLVTLSAGDRVELAWNAVQTTVLEGAVLEPASADAGGGTARRGVPARLVVVDADGLRRAVSTGVDGTFVLRGLIPGPVSVRLVEVPVGATILGDPVTSVVLAEGAAGFVEFTVEPVRARAQSFTDRAIRVRSVSSERDRVPPGSAPIVRVEVAGDADVVELRHGDAVVTLERQGEAWLGRLPIPDAHADGSFTFTAAAIAGSNEATRRAQVEVDGASAAIEARTNAPVRLGDTLRIEAHAVVDLVALDVTIESIGTFSFQVVEAGRWVVEVEIPRDAPEGIAEAHLGGLDASGRAYAVVQAFRIVGE